MGTLFKIAWRNIWRNKRRSLVIMTAIALGLTGGNFIASAYMGLMHQTLEESVHKQLSHIQIHHPDFVADRDIRYPIDRALTLADSLRRLEDVKAVSARLVIDGMVASAHHSAGVTIRGIHPGQERQTTGLDTRIEEGSYFTEQGRFPSVIIGKELAGELQGGIGSRIVLTFQDKQAGMISASFRVEGLFSSASADWEKGNVYVRIGELWELAEVDEAVTEIALLLHQDDRLGTMTSGLKERFPGLSVRNWKQIAPELEFIVEYTEMSLLWIVGIILLGVAFGILNTILMSVLERTHELGVLLSVGMKKARVFSMVMLETIMLSLTGGVVGLAASRLIIGFLQPRGIDLTLIGGEALREWGFSPVLTPELHAGFYLKVTLMIVFFAILAAIYPARKAITLQPAEAVRKRP